MKLIPVVTLLSSLLVAPIAQAETFSNTSTGSIYPFGAPDTTSYGQTFTLSTATTLADWSFFAQSGAAGNLSFVVAAWDGAKAVGPALYSASGSYAGGTQALAFGGIDSVLASGNYIAYLTVAGVSDAVSGLVMSASNSNGGLGGTFAFLNSNGTDPLTLNNSWTTNFGPGNLQYSANFAAAVPEPETYALMLAGLGVLGFVARRRKNA